MLSPVLPQQNYILQTSLEETYVDRVTLRGWPHSSRISKPLQKISLARGLLHQSISRSANKASSSKIEDLFIELDNFIKLFFFHGPQHDSSITFDQVWRISLNVLTHWNPLHAAERFLTFP